LRGLRDLPEQEILDEGRKLWEKAGLMPLLESSYQSMIDAFRNSAEILLETDVRALENGVALQPESQQLAHEQVMTAAKLLREELPPRKLKPLAGRHEVPTRVLDEDTYPVGGYASISTHGSIESLLHSQLAYMEPVARPDLFDIKYLRDELFYYSRDENQFLRRRRTFVFAFYPDLALARTKDPGIPYQRIIMLLGLLYAAISILTEWLSDDSLKFVFVFLTDGDSMPLGHEYGLLEMLFREQIENKSVRILPGLKDDKISGKLGEADLAGLCRAFAQRSLCHCVLLSAQERILAWDDVEVTRLILDDALPSVHGDGDDVALDSWASSLERLLQLWI
jgi:vWA domain found in the FtsH ternary systems